MENKKIDLITRFLVDRKRSFQNIRLSPDYNNFVNRFYKIDKKNQKKGEEFEAFVVSHFDSNYFKLIEWRSDKRTDDIYPLSSKFPDLEFYFESSSHALVFAVECKWRSDFHYNKVSLKESHLQNYRLYEEVTGHTTFIILGIGNRPGAPNNLYIIPLSKIANVELHEWELEVYKRKNIHENFFLDCHTTHLK